MPLQNMQNIPPLYITETLLMMKQNAIFMQNENKFGTEKPKGFKLKKIFIYTEKNTHELKN